MPRDLETIVATAMEADPARRYQSADEMADDLERLLSFQPIRARRAGVITRGLKLVRRHRGAAVGLTLGSIVTLCGAGLLVAYVFFLPGWVAAHVREARLALIDPGQANDIVSRLFWGRHNAPGAAEIGRQIAAFDLALTEYDAALRLAPFNEALRRERDIVARVRDRSASGVGENHAGARIPSRTDSPPESLPARRDSREGIPERVRARKNSRTSETTSAKRWVDKADPPYDDRDAGLLAFLSAEYDGAIEAWSRWEKTRDPLGEPDPLVDAALGILYLFDDQAARAYPRLQKAVEAFPGVGFLMEYLADAAAKCGDAERARRWLEESKRLSRRDTLGASERINAGVLAAEGRTDDAIAAYRAMYPFGPPQFELARLLEHENQLAEALTEYADLMQTVPRSARIQTAFRSCADRWWRSLSKPQRRHRIHSAVPMPERPMSSCVPARAYRDGRKWRS